MLVLLVVGLSLGKITAAPGQKVEHLVVRNDRTEVSEDVAVKIPVLRNDSDHQSGLDTASLQLISSPTANGGYVEVDSAEGMLIYKSARDFFGRDTFSYQICNRTGQCGVAQVYVLVHPMEDPPVAMPDTMSVEEDGILVLDPTQNDFDRDHPGLGELSLSILNQPHAGRVSLVGAREMRYEPKPNYFGKDFFYYRLCDGSDRCDSAMVQILVNPVNDPPVINPDFDTTFQNLPSVINPLANDYDSTDRSVLDPKTLELVRHQSAAGGTLFKDTSTYLIIYVPPLNYVGVDSFAYRICDHGISDVFCDTGSVQILILPGFKRSQHAVYPMPITSQAIPSKGIKRDTSNVFPSSDDPSIVPVVTIKPPN